MPLRKLSIAPLLAALVAAAAFAGSASASTSSFGISAPNVIHVFKSQPNLMVNFTETNSGSAAWCNVRVPEINPDSGGYWVASSPFLLTTGQTGLGTSIPTTKKSSLTFELWCSPSIDGVLVMVASTKSKVIVAGQV